MGGAGSSLRGRDSFPAVVLPLEMGPLGGDFWEAQAGGAEMGVSGNHEAVDAVLKAGTETRVEEEADEGKGIAETDA